MKDYKVHGYVGRCESCLRMLDSGSQRRMTNTLNHCLFIAVVCEQWQQCSCFHRFVMCN
jgi:hypothetical protein